MPAVVLAAALGALYLLFDPPSADLAAHLYRADLVRHSGFVVWDNGWYGGHHLPGYSLLFPPLGALVGVRVVAALSIVAGTAAFAALARERLAPPAAMLASAWFAAGLAAAAISGRLPFVFGAAIGTAAVLAACRRRAALAATAGAATALASPVAGLFVALVGVALRTRVALLAGVVVAGALVVGLFPEGGSEPFAASAFLPALAAVALGLAVAPRGPLRTGLVLYALVLVAAALVPTPLGGNAARLGALLGGPLAVAMLWDRRALLVLAALPLAYWVLYPAIRDWSAAAGDPARPAAYYTPLLAELRARAGAPTRLEIPFTKGHWEAYRVAPAIPLARGWERQLDRKENALFYSGTLTAERYRRWLVGNAIGWVALPDAPFDDSARAEAVLIRTRPPYLREVWRGAHWRLYAVRGAAPLGATRLGTDDFTTTGGLVRVRWTPYWALRSGRGCLRRSPTGWTLVTPAAGVTSVHVGIDFNPWRALSDGPRCR